MASLAAAYCVYGTCPGDAHFFNDEECRHTVRFSHMWLCFFTAGYLVVDTLLILLAVGVHTTMDRQLIIHHVVAFLAYYCAFWQQDFAVTQGAIFIFLEVSTPFVCIR